MACGICTEPFNKSTRCAITCFSCDLSACKECVRKFLVSSTTLPSCMNCKTRFPLQFLVRHLNRSWVLTTYKQKMAELLTGNQLGLLPDTQPHVEADIHREQLMRDMSKNNEEIRKLNSRIHHLKMMNRAHDYQLRGEEVPINLRGMVSDIRVTVDTRKRFIMACPLESCRGFLSNHYKCGTCQKNICSDCLCLKQEDHVCNENDRLSAEMIKRETKPCPKCGTRIHKIDGCDQMYCTNQQDGAYCNTAFSWRSGEIVTGTIHNPHFYELQQRKGIQMRNVGDIQCGGMPRMTNLVRILQYAAEHNTVKDPEFHPSPTFQGHRIGFIFTTSHQGTGYHQDKSIDYDTELRSRLVRIHRRLSEIIQYTAHDYRERVRNHDTVLLRLRIDYMRGKRTKESFADLVYKEETAHMKRLDIQQILELISISGIETFVGMLREVPPEEEWIQICRSGDVSIITKMIEIMEVHLEQLSKIREYCNDQMKHISITYNCTVTEYDKTFQETTVKYNMNGEKKKLW
jgi:hypothetical protein